jgi:V8-like Glu-specific endopeptidase
MLDQWLLFADAKPTVVVVTGGARRNTANVPLDAIVADRLAPPDLHAPYGTNAPGSRDQSDDETESVISVPEPSATEQVLSRIHDEKQASRWLARLSGIRRRVCRIKNGQQAMATGFLIGPELVATASFVIDPRTSPDNTEVQFDFEIVDGVVQPGRLIPVRAISVEGRMPPGTTATDPGAPASFGLLELKEPEGDRSIDGKPKRGWFDLTSSAGEVVRGQPLFLFHHPQGAYLRMSEGNLIDRAGDNRLRYQAETAPGSSGAPLFNERFQLLGLHEARLPDDHYPNLKLGLCSQAIASVLQAKGRTLYPWIEPEPDSADAE